MSSLIHGLLRPEAYDHDVSSFHVLETHISWVILTGRYAYKLKKPVDLGFVDFTTAERRQHFCNEEIRLNRRLAPDLYLGVRPVMGTIDQPTFVGSGMPIDFAVQMRQFDQETLLPVVLQHGELRADHLDRLAVTLAEFQHQAATAEPESPYGTPDAVRQPVRANFAALESSPLSAEQFGVLERLKTWSELEYERKCDWFQRRHEMGRIREGHGDLHLGNMVLLEDVIRPFDCLEFNPALRWIDVISEIAFLVMDLQERGRADLGFHVLNRWLEHSGDYGGLTGWNWYFAYRALVRAKVAALRLRQLEPDSEERTAKLQELDTYLELASRSTKSKPVALIVMRGVSGSGKSYVANWVCEQLGAIQLRSDVERKRLFGQWGIPTAAPAVGDLYGSDVTQTVYRDILGGLVPSIISAGFSVVIDAACLQRWQRSVFRDLAAQHRWRSLMIDVQAAPETLRRRLARRQALGGDPSDADISILERQLAEREPLTPDESAAAFTVDTDSPDWRDRLRTRLESLLAN